MSGERVLRNCRIRFPGRGIDEHSFRGEGTAHVGEHVPWGGGDHIDGETRPQPVPKGLADGRLPMAHLHLDLRGDRNFAARVLDQVPLLIAEVAAVDVGGVGAEQIEPLQLFDHAEPPGQPAHGDMDRNRKAELARHLPLLRNDVVDAEAWTAGGQLHCQQAIFR